MRSYRLLGLGLLAAVATSVACGGDDTTKRFANLGGGAGAGGGVSGAGGSATGGKAAAGKAGAAGSAQAGAGQAGASGGTAGQAGQAGTGGAGQAGGGQAGASAAGKGGSSGAAGKAGAAGNAGTGGAGQAGTGGAGQAGTGGAGQAGAGGAGQAGAGGAGNAGTGGAGKAGAGGAGQSGGGAAGNAGTTTGGSAGSGGGSGCKADLDCAGLTVDTNPTDCAEPFCDAGTCAFRSRDVDADQHRNATCASLLVGVVVKAGDDCDDADALRFPGAWDGPVDGAKLDACNGVDNDCNGQVDDGTTALGVTCSCTPGATLSCAEDVDGSTLTFPTLDATGKPLGKCALGVRTCGGDSKWGLCVGTVGPDLVDICNAGVDDDCDGKADMLDTVVPPNTTTWSFDGDGDGYSPADPTAKAESCDDSPPKTCPTGSPGCALSGWKLGDLPATDCDDKSATNKPFGTEVCDGVDNDCNALIDDDVLTAPLWYFDYDGDTFGDADTPPARSCTRPTTLPDFCVTVTQVAGSYCTGVAGEGAAPVCPPPACTTAMWAKGIPNTDCKDHPVDSDLSFGNKPALVFPGSQDRCNTLDYDCDGSPATGCACGPIGSTQACGDAAACNVGTQTCVTPGNWSACSGGSVKPTAIYCPDADIDGYCDLAGCTTPICAADVPTNVNYKLQADCTGFAQQLTDCLDTEFTVNPSAVEKCGDSVDSNCQGDDSDGFNIGAPCSFGSGLGACGQAGRRGCSGPSSTSCTAGYTVDTVCHASEVVVDGQPYGWDSDCDGVVDLCNAGINQDFQVVDVLAGGTYTDATKLLVTGSQDPAVLCAAVRVADCGVYTFVGSLTGTCGDPMFLFNCQVNGGACEGDCYNHASGFPACTLTAPLGNVGCH